MADTAASPGDLIPPAVLIYDCVALLLISPPKEIDIFCWQELCQVHLSIPAVPDSCTKAVLCEHVQGKLDTGKEQVNGSREQEP